MPHSLFYNQSVQPVLPLAHLFLILPFPCLSGQMYAIKSIIQCVDALWTFAVVVVDTNKATEKDVYIHTYIWAVTYTTSE